jgi:hypothetical protein
VRSRLCSRHTTRITGTVKDPQGSPISGATVTIRRAGVDTPLTTQTSDSGHYVFDLIQAGTYEVSVEKAGFSRFVSTDNVAQINVPTTVNVTLAIGDRQCDRYRCRRAGSGSNGHVGQCK